MIKITYQTYSPVLDKTFTDVKVVKTMADFRLFAFAMFSGHWTILTTEDI